MMDYHNLAGGFNRSGGQRHLGLRVSGTEAESGDDTKHRRNTQGRCHNPGPERRVTAFGWPPGSSWPRLILEQLGSSARMTGRSRLFRPMAKPFDSSQLGRVG